MAYNSLNKQSTQIGILVLKFLLFAILATVCPAIILSLAALFVSIVTNYNWYTIVRSTDFMFCWVMLQTASILTFLLVLNWDVD